MGDTVTDSIRFESNDAGIRALLNSDMVRAEIGRRAANVAAAAGDGFKSGTQKGRDRVRAAVWSATVRASRAQAKDRVLTRAIDAARR